MPINGLYNTGYHDGPKQLVGAGYEQESFTKRLLRRKGELEVQLANVNEALDALKNSPEVERAVNAITRIGF